jgi:hypothetical protein
MKRIIILAVCMAATLAHAQVTRCYKNGDGSVTCYTSRGGGF